MKYAIDDSAYIVKCADCPDGLSLPTKGGFSIKFPRTKNGKYVFGGRTIYERAQCVVLLEATNLHNVIRNEALLWHAKQVEKCIDNPMMRPWLACPLMDFAGKLYNNPLYDFSARGHVSGAHFFAIVYGVVDASSFLVIVRDPDAPGAVYVEVSTMLFSMKSATSQQQRDAEEKSASLMELCSQLTSDYVDLLGEHANLLGIGTG